VNSSTTVAAGAGWRCHFHSALPYSSVELEPQVGMPPPVDSQYSHYKPEEREHVQCRGWSWQTDPQTHAQE